MEKKKKSVQKAYTKLIRRLRIKGSRAVRFAEQSATERGYEVPKESIASILADYPASAIRTQKEIEELLRKKRKK